MLRFRAARSSDAAWLAPRLRQCDREEIQAAVGRAPEETLAAGIASSDPCWAVVAPDETLLALFGVVPDRDASRSGMVWLLGTDELASHRLTVLRLSRTWVNRLQEQYDYLWNYIDARNVLHLEWLRWCGFELVKRMEHHGYEQRPFWRFERRSSRPEC